jgi:endonuclease YncB( thermonuclease family)
MAATGSQARHASSGEGARVTRWACLAALILGVAIFAAPASAQTFFQAPCVPGTDQPLCTVQTGKVTAVDDGDTLDVHVHGAGFERIRITGINAMEMSVYNRNPAKQQGDCHALEATALLSSLVKRSHKKVRVLSVDRLSRSRHRPVRTVQVFIRNSWHDVGNLMISRGLSLWLPNLREWAWNGQYSFIEQQAASRRVGLWSPTYCGLGPDDDIPIRVTVHPNARGNDTINVNGEWVTITNLGARDLPLGGWWIRDSGLRRYTFPYGVTVPVGTSMRLRVGKGDDDLDTFYWNLKAPVFENASGNPKYMGDGAYLFDPQGDIRAWDIYPCRLACTSSHTRNI